MTPYRPEELAGYEFKIIRGSTAIFKDPVKMRAILEEEARAGWELVEKFDNARIRLKRRLEWREKDEFLGQDPYRITVGIGEGALVAIILGCVFGAMALFGAIAAFVAML